MRPEEASGFGGAGEGGGEEAGAAQAHAAAARAQADHRLVRRHTLLVRTKSTAEPARIRALGGKRERMKSKLSVELGILSGRSGGGGSPEK